MPWETTSTANLAVNLTNAPGTVVKTPDWSTGAESQPVPHPAVTPELLRWQISWANMTAPELVRSLAAPKLKNASETPPVSTSPAAVTEPSRFELNSKLTSGLLGL